MTFSNAFEGIKKVFLAEILVLIGLGCTILGGLISGVSAIGGSLTGVGGGVIFIVGGAVLSILALIFNMIGLSRASRDESSFKTAFICTLINLIVAVVFGILSVFMGVIVSTIASILNAAFSIVILIYVFRGIGILAAKLNREDVPKFGKPVMILMIVVNGVTIFTSLMTLLGASGFVSVLSVLSGIAGIVAYILYLVYLNRAKHMLEA